MIDYDTLKSYLEEKRHEKHKTCLTDLFDNGYFWAIKDMESFMQEIDIPEETTQPEPKYKDAWYIENQNGIRCTKVLNKEGYIHCDKSDIKALGRIMYPTKAALIQSQIEYWLNLREEHDIELHGIEGARPWENTESEYCNVSGAKIDKFNPAFEGEIKGFFCRHAFVFSSDANDQVCYHCNKTKKELHLGDYDLDKECEHESDGMCYTSYPLQYKCIKCGEFYR